MTSPSPPGQGCGPRALVSALLLSLVFAGPVMGETVKCEWPGIIDGDTLQCGSERIRIWGIDSVERGQPGYREAGEHLQKLTRGPVECVGKYRDRYRRLVAMCYLSKSDIGGQMVRDGFAKDYPRYSGGYYSTGGRGK